MKRYLLVAGIVWLAMGAYAQEQPQVPAVPAVTLKKAQKVGTVMRYRINAVADAGGTEVTVERTVRFEIKEVKENGDVVLLMKDEGGKIVAMGQEMEVPLAGTVTIVTDKLGRITKYQRGTDELSVMAPELEHVLSVAQDFVLPEKEVRPNDTWQYDLENPIVKGKKVTMKCTYAGFEKVEDAQVWKVKQLVSAPVDAEGGKMEAEMVFLVRPDDGVAVRTEGKFKSVPSQYGPVDITWKTTLLKPEASQTSAK